MTHKYFFLLVLFPFLLMAQHRISGTFSPANEFKYAILYKITPTETVYIDNTEIDNSGNFEFRLSSNTKAGVYRIVYALPEEEYNFDLIYNAKEDIELQFSMDSGVVYLNSVENQLLDTYTKSIAQQNTNLNAYYSSNIQGEISFHAIFDDLKKVQNYYEQVSEGLLANHFIKASRPYIPKQFENAQAFSENLKTHYFDSIDFGNETLQSSNFLVDAVINFILTYATHTENLDSFKQHINLAVKAIGEHQLVKKEILEVLWFEFVNVNLDELANFIADTYLLKMMSSNDPLYEHITNFKKTSLGKIAPDFAIPSENNDDSIQLHDYTISKQYLIVFWSSTCGHCLEELPMLHTYIEKIDSKQLKIIAIGLEGEDSNWEEKKLKLPNFIHVLGEDKWDNPIGNAYGVKSTPSYFILNQEKKIIAKPYDLEAIKSYVQSNLSLEKQD